MHTTIQKWGNSQGIRIPKQFLEALDLRGGDRVEIGRQQDVITIRKAGLRHRTLEERLAGFEGSYEFTEWDTGAPVCPITNTNRGIPLHVQLDDRTKTTGVIMCDQVKALDMQSRNATLIEKVPQDLIAEAVDIVVAIIEIL